MPAPATASFLARRDLTRGIAIPTSSVGLSCVIFAQAEVSVDDLETGARLAEDIAFMHEQGVLNRLSQQAATAQTRLSLARDLHDSVAQLLAGISFRLEALKRSGKSAEQLASELEDLQAELATEQDHVRTLIRQLREPSKVPPLAELPERLQRLTDRLARQWAVECTFTHLGPALTSTTHIGEEIEQMVREGAANAVRHGRASRISIILRTDPEGCELMIEDDGIGLAQVGGASEVKPRSLTERAEALGGSLQSVWSGSASTIRIRLPIQAPR